MIPKLRAWDKQDECMSYGEVEYFDDSINYRFDHFCIGADEDVEFMQSTGLKDKNGIEIYEGDIVRHSPTLTDISIIKYGEFGVPDFENETYQDIALGWYFENASDLKDIAPFNMTVPVNKQYIAGIEVIGNIYENPELLEGHEK